MKNILKKENINSYYKNALFVGIVALSIFGLSGAHAQGMMNKGEKGDIARQGEGRMMALEKGQKDILGTVTSINGNTLTITSMFKSEDKNKGEGKNSATTTKIFTVDATNAKIIKNNATTSVSSIVVGDKVSIVGAISGTNITAKIIRDNIGGMMGQGGERDWRNASSTASSTNIDIHREDGPKQNPGFFQKTKNFFRRMFGF